MSDLNIGKVIIDQTKTSQVTVNYADTSKPDTSTITSNRTQMTATVDSISTVFEVSKTYYFDADGGLVTTNQGYGTLGTTDSDGVLTVAHLTPSLEDFRIEESESEYRVAEDIHFTAYVNYGNLPSIWAVYAQYSSDGITYEDIQSATVGGSGLANITECLIPAGASGTIYLRARVGDVYSDPIEATVVTPEIVISAVDVTVDVPFTISGTCNLAKNLRISYAKDPYNSWTVVDNSVTVQPNGTWSVEGVVISETGNFRLKAEYIQDTVSIFSDTEDVVVASAGASKFVLTRYGSNNFDIEIRNISDGSLFDSYNVVNDSYYNASACMDAENVYYTVFAANKVYCRKRSDWSLVWEHGGTGSGNSQLKWPNAICCRGDSVYVVDQGNHRIKRIKKSDGTYTAQTSVSNYDPLDVIADDDLVYGLYLYVGSATRYIRSMPLNLGSNTLRVTTYTEASFIGQTLDRLYISTATTNVRSFKKSDWSVVSNVNITNARGLDGKDDLLLALHSGGNNSVRQISYRDPANLSEKTNVDLGSATKLPTTIRVEEA